MIVTPFDSGLYDLSKPDALEAELVMLEKSVRKEYQMNSTEPSSQTAEAKAEATGMKIIYPESNQLQIDIDTPHAMSIFRTMEPLINKFYKIIYTEVKNSKSGYPKQHVTVTMENPVTNFERIAIQACVGSDRVREFLGVVQERNNDPHPTLFLEKTREIPEVTAL